MRMIVREGHLDQSGAYDLGQMLDSTWRVAYLLCCTRFLVEAALDNQIFSRIAVVVQVSFCRLQKIHEVTGRVK